MAQAYIVDALRSPTGKRKGALSEIHAIDLGAHVLKALVDRNAIPAEDYDDVIFGCVDTIGSQAGDIARTSWLAAGLPLTVPGTTVDRQCGSSQQALHFAAQAVMSGTQDVVGAMGNPMDFGNLCGASPCEGEGKLCPTLFWVPFRVVFLVFKRLISLFLQRVFHDHPQCSREAHQ